MKLLSYIGAAILIIISLFLFSFGFIFILGAFSPDSSSATGSMITGIILVAIGLVFLGGAVALIYFASRKPIQPAGNNVTLKIDLPGNVSMDTLKCKSCGGVLTSADIQMVAGAPMVTCPYCKTSYQLTEEPKW
jgi:hypothetical protein